MNQNARKDFSFLLRRAQQLVILNTAVTRQLKELKDWWGRPTKTAVGDRQGEQAVHLPLMLLLPRDGPNLCVFRPLCLRNITCPGNTVSGRQPAGEAWKDCPCARKPMLTHFLSHRAHFLACGNPASLLHSSLQTVILCLSQSPRQS